MTTYNFNGLAFSETYDIVNVGPGPNDWEWQQTSGVLSAGPISVVARDQTDTLSYTIDQLQPEYISVDLGADLGALYGLAFPTRTAFNAASDTTGMFTEISTISWDSGAKSVSILNIGLEWEDWDTHTAYSVSVAIGLEGDAFPTFADYAAFETFVGGLSFSNAEPAGFQEGDVVALTAFDGYIGQTENDYILGTDVAETYKGGAGNDKILSLGGLDTLFGGTGGDTLNGGAGADSIEGGKGFDLILGGDQGDRLFGGTGNDTVSGGKGADFANLGGGNDVFNDIGQTGAAGKDTVVAGAGNDAINGGGGNDHFSGQGGKDTITGGAGNDTLEGGGGNDRLDGGNGNDAHYGGAGSDTVYGGGGSDYARGDGGNDRIFGGAGRDNLFGNDGNDSLVGGIGNDTLSAGRGDDTLIGGGGGDNFVFSALQSTDANVVTDYTVGLDDIDLAQFIMNNLTIAVVDTDVLLTAGNGGTILFEGTTDVTAIHDDIFGPSF